MKNPFTRTGLMQDPGASAQEKLREWQAAARVQERAQAKYTWGSTFTLTTFTLGGGVRNTETFISLGPFPEPQCVALEMDSEDPRRQVQVELQATIGIGDTTIVQTFEEIPRSIVCQSLTVRASRVDLQLGATPNDPRKVSIWAAPFLPRVTPYVLESEVIDMAVGVAIIGLRNPPYGATHVQGSFGNTDHIVDIALTYKFPGGESAGVRHGLNSSSATVHQSSPPIALARQRVMSASLVRTPTTNQRTFTVNWLRV